MNDVSSAVPVLFQQQIGAEPRPLPQAADADLGIGRVVCRLRRLRGVRFVGVDDAAPYDASHQAEKRFDGFDLGAQNVGNQELRWKSERLRLFVC